MARITLDIDDELWSLCKTNARRYRFGSTSKLLRAILDLTNKRINDMWHQEDDGEQIEADLAEMFDGFTYWEPLPDGACMPAARRRGAIEMAFERGEV